MEPFVFDHNKTFTLYGFSKRHEDPSKPYSATMFELMDKLWGEVRSKGLSHKGINHVVYDLDQVVFAGIELTDAPQDDSQLERREVVLEKYAYCKHIGPYSQLGQTYERIQSAIQAAGEQVKAPSLEVYGHWNADESKLETEIYFQLV
ncbi:GyrI-like domain-containing protein [Paenibacillus cremeus]|uniref:GyrI-like domain-containing protein n=1 Tax=Paenibacillus cremeus TaxID=2163881 RepID=A0A559K9R0_9BACL|nr:GyrI-like domain-containing protein [Paenibacillus cremeus]TVY08856.1 GyrI-like domain-containing protein [Paenibacillus cremeus]